MPRAWWAGCIASPLVTLCLGFTKARNSCRIDRASPIRPPSPPRPPVRRVLCRGACRDARLVSWCVSGRRFGMLRGLDFGRALCTPRRERDVRALGCGSYEVRAVLVRRTSSSNVTRAANELPRALYHGCRLDVRAPRGAGGWSGGCRGPRRGRGARGSEVGVLVKRGPRRVTVAGRGRYARATTRIDAHDRVAVKE